MTNFIKQSMICFSLLFLCAYLCACTVNPVTQKNEFNLISEKQEIAIGKQQYLASQKSQGGRYTEDPALERYVQNVGYSLAKVSHRPGLPYEFVIVNDNTPNAWCLPGGKIAIHKGLLTELKNEAELAAVLSHEIVHASARHGAQGMQRGLLLGGALAALDLALNNKGADKKQAASHTPILLGSGVAGQMILTRYGREAEFEADAYGMVTLSKAGYDPKAAVTLQETFIRLSKEKRANWLKGLFASHPPSEARLAANRKTAESLPKGGNLHEARYQAAISRLKRRGQTPTY